MASYAAMAPWNRFRAIPGNTGIKNSLDFGDMQWHLSSGWHFKGSHAKGKHYKMGNILGYDGKTKKVRIYDDYIGFHANENVGDPQYQERLAYAEHAFNSTPADNVVGSDGCGHISKVEYAIKEQILKVTFTNNGSVCLFFRVPSAVAGSLLRFAMTKQTSGRFHSNGEPIHTLGIVFWDYIRIRGNQHGAKYPWEYEKKAEGKIVNSKNRHVMQLTAKRAIAILEDDNPVSKRLKAQGATLRPNDLVTVVLNDSEYDKLGDEVNNLLASKSGGIQEGREVLQGGSKDDPDSHKKDRVDTNNQYDSIEDRVARKQILDAVARFEKSGKPMPQGLIEEYQELRKADEMAAAKKAMYQQTGTSALADYVSKAEAELKQAIETFRERYSTDISAEAASIRRSLERSGAIISNDTAEGTTKKKKRIISDDTIENRAIYRLIKDYNFKNLKDIIRLRGPKWAKGLPEQLQLIAGKDYDTAKAIIKAAFGEGAIKAWVDANIPAKYAMHFVGRFWTPQELITFANPNLPNSIALKDAPDYKRLIAARDWQGALNLLKTRYTDLVYEDRYGNKKVLRHEHYASQYDKVADDEET